MSVSYHTKEHYDVLCCRWFILSRKFEISHKYKYIHTIFTAGNTKALLDVYTESVCLDTTPYWRGTPFPLGNNWLWRTSFCIPPVCVRILLRNLCDGLASSVSSPEPRRAVRNIVQPAQAGRISAKSDQKKTTDLSGSKMSFFSYESEV